MGGSGGAVCIPAGGCREIKKRWRNQFTQLVKTLVHYWVHNPKEHLDFYNVVPILAISLEDGDHRHAN